MFDRDMINFVNDCIAAFTPVAVDGETGYSPDWLTDRHEWIIGGVIEPLTLDPDVSTTEQFQAWFRSMGPVTRETVMHDLAAGVYGIGSWLDKRGRVVLDVCDTRANSLDALGVARRRGEDAIWHPDHGEMEV